MRYYSFERRVKSRLEGQTVQREERDHRRFGMKLPGADRGYGLTFDRNTLASLVYRSSFPLTRTEVSLDREGTGETPSGMNGAEDQTGG